MEKSISSLKVSQFYLSERKLKAIEEWLTEDPDSMNEPIIIRKINGQDTILDGHSRAFVAYQKGWQTIPAQYDEQDQWPHYQTCAEEAVRQGINSVLDLENRILDDRDYQEKWIAYCQSLSEVKVVKKIHLTGDSLMARHEDADQPMVNLMLHALDENLVIHNTAISGNSTRDLLARYQDMILEEESDYLFVLVGTNDLSSDRDIAIDEFEANLERLIEIFETRYPRKHIHFLLPPPVDESKMHLRTNANIAAYGHTIVDVCQRKGCQALDLNQAFRDAATKEVPLDQLLIGVKDDGLHFGRMGYRILAKTIYQALT